MIQTSDLKALWGSLAIRKDIENALPFLIDYASRTNVIVELGCHFGNGSTKAFRVGLANNPSADREKLMITVDIKYSLLPDAKPTEPWWHMLIGNTTNPQTLDAAKKILNGRQVEMLFIDTDHTAACVLKELDLWVPLCAYTSMVVFHDTGVKNPPCPFVDYAHAIEEYARSHNFDLDHVVKEGQGLSVMKFCSSKE